ALLKQPEGMTSIEIHAVGLTKGTFIPIQLDPAHAIENSLDRCVGRPILVGVFNAKNEHAVLLPGKQPVEQGRPHPADMEEAGRTGRKSNPDLTHRVTVVCVEECNGGLSITWHRNDVQNGAVSF